MCFFNFVHKEAFENLVFEDIRQILKTSKVDSEKVVIMEDTTSTAEVELLKANLGKVKYKFQKQLEAFEADVISLKELQEAKKRVVEEENELKKQLQSLQEKKEKIDLGTNLSTHFEGIDEILKSNDPKAIKLWLKERIYKIEVFNKKDVKIQYKLPW